MNRGLSMLLAGMGIFAGSLLSDSVFGDGIQMDDIEQAVTLGILAAVMQWLLGRGRS